VAGGDLIKVHGIFFGLDRTLQGILDVGFIHLFSPLEC
jgi:hypothetical protein